MGHYEFRICDQALDAGSLSSAAEGQRCLDQWLLERAPPLGDCVVNDPRGDCQPMDPKHPERWHLTCQECSDRWPEVLATSRKPDTRGWTQL